MVKGGSSMAPVFDHDGDGVVGSAGDYSTGIVDGTLVSFGIAASQASGGATTAPSFHRRSPIFVYHWWGRRL